MPVFSTDKIFDLVVNNPIVPVFYHADADHAQAIVKACYDGGLRVFEFTNRGENAYNVFVELLFG